MQLDLISPRGEDPARVAAKGRITAMDLASTGRNPIAELLGPGWSTKRLLVDLSRTDYLDSSAIGWLIQTNGEFKRNGGALVLHSLPPMVKQVLGLLKIGSLIPLKENEADARAHLSGVVTAAPAGPAGPASAGTSATTT
jgi:anti-anti-sigma factor